MKKFILFFCFVFINQIIQAQSEIDSLNGLLKKEKQTEKQLLLLIKLTEISLDSRPDLALPYVNRILNLAYTQNNEKAEAMGLKYLGRVYLEQSLFEDALDCFIKSLNLTQKLKMTELQVAVQDNIGVVYTRLQNFDKALTNFRTALQLASNIQNNLLMVRVVTHIGEVYLLKKDFSEAMVFLQDAINKCGNSSSMELFKARALQLFSNVFANTGEYEKALTYLEPAYRTFLKKTDSKGIIRACLEYGFIYREKGEYQQSSDFLHRSLILAKKINAKKETSDIYESLSFTCQKSDSLTKALEYSRLSMAYNDSLLSEKNVQNISRLLVQYDIQKKEKDLKKLEELSLSKSKQVDKQYRWNSVLVILFVIVLALTFILIYNNYQKNKTFRLLKQNNEAIIHQKEEINSQNEQLQELDKEKNSMIRIVAHDLKAPLNRVLGLSELINLEVERLSEAQIKYLNLIRRVAADGTALIQNLLDFRAIEERSLKVEMAEVNIPELLNDLLVGFKEPAEKKGIHLSFINESGINEMTIVSDSGFLNRVFDNLISNAIKFSPLNKNVYIRLKDNHSKIYIAIQDEGVGISKEDFGKLFKKFQKLSARPTAGESSTGLGLSIVKTLLNQINGEIYVESVVGEGTTFTVELPKKEVMSTNRTAEALED